MKTARRLVATVTIGALIGTFVSFAHGQSEAVSLNPYSLDAPSALLAVIEGVSPDGDLLTSSFPTLSGKSERQIAFNCWVGGTYQVCLMNADGTGLRQLTDSSESSVGPVAWSHSGKKVAFSLEGVVYTMNADGSGLVRLSPQPGTPTSQDFTPDWSPSDKLIIFANINQSADTSSIWTMNAAGGSNRQELLPDNGAFYMEPHYTPDGRFIIMVGSQTGICGNWQLYATGPHGDHFSQITNIPGVIFDPAIAPSGRQIAVEYAPASTSNLNIGVMDIDEVMENGSMVIEGSDLHPITDLIEPIEAADPAWSHDGTQITFEVDNCTDLTNCTGESNPAAPAEIFTIDPDGSNMRGTGQACVAVECSPRYRPS